MNKHIITIAGDIGSGKSKSAKGSAASLKFEHKSSGDYARSLGTKAKKKIGEMSIEAEQNKDSTYDDMVDAWVREQGKGDRFVMDSRLAFHWIPESFKVYLRVDSKIGAKRMFKDLPENPERRESEHFETVEEMEKWMHDRFESDCRRYKEKYGITYTDLSQYDLVIDTGIPGHDVKYVVNKILSEYYLWLGRKKIKESAG